MKNYDFDVRFVGNYYNLYTTVVADNEEQAERYAIDRIAEEYGWDLTDTYFEVEIIKQGEYA
jgi:hypothetical protein